MPKLITDIWCAFLGGYSSAPSGVIDANKVWGSVRDGLMVVLAACATHAHGFGVLSIIHCVFAGLSSSWWIALIVGILQFLRRLRKDYSDAAKQAASAAQIEDQDSDG